MMIRERRIVGFLILIDFFSTCFRSSRTTTTTTTTKEKEKENDWRLDQVRCTRMSKSDEKHCFLFHFVTRRSRVRKTKKNNQNKYSFTLQCGWWGRKDRNWSIFDEICLRTSLNNCRFIDGTTGIININDRSIDRCGMNGEFDLFVKETEKVRWTSLSVSLSLSLSMHWSIFFS